MMMLITQGKVIDSDNTLGPFAYLLTLDTLNLYGSKIYMLHNDVCKRNINHTIVILRAFQLGFLTQENINKAINNRGEGIDIEDLIPKVRAILPNFIFDNELTKEEKEIF